ncbi:MAG TPA: hypothetical protein PKE06_21550, partial [Flavilitoribacter sp.]|nr:hypothetical protein [Flavilitoribacter sp.]
MKKGAVAMVISAPSGLGKSSFARAGLYPKMKNELGFEDLLQMRPGQSPGTALDKLKKQVDPHKKQVLLIDQYEELYTVCMDESQRQDFESGLMQIFDDASKDKNKTRILITVRSDYEWRLENSGLGKKLLESQDSHPALFRLAPMNLDQLREALVNPALMEAFEFESPQLVDRILQEISFAPGALPLLSLAMKWLFQGVQKIRAETDADVRVFTTKHYEQLGGINQCLSKMADAVYDRFDEAHRGMMRNILLRMVQLQEGGLVRRRVYINPFTASQQETATHELDFPGDDQDKICLAVLNALEGNISGDKLEGINLLLWGTDENGREYVEPAHDSLINFWPTCLEWIDEFGKEQLILQRELWRAAEESMRVKAQDTATTGEAQETGINTNTSPFDELRLWDTNRKLEQLFERLLKNNLRGLQTGKAHTLQEAVGRIERTLNGKDQEAFREFIKHILAEGGKPDFDALIITGASGSLLDALLDHGDHWLNQAEVAFIRKSWEKRTQGILQLKRERDEAKAIALPVLARRLKDNAVALNLAMAAHRLHPNQENSSVLIDFLNKSFCKTIFHGHNATVSSVAFSPDGTSILTGSFDKTARLWNIKDQSFKSFAGHEEGVTSVAFSPDGKSILTGSEDKTVRLWNIKDQSFISFAGHEKGVTSVAFSPDGKYILTSSYDHTARLWSIKDQSFISFAGHEKVATPAVFSQDGQSILTGSRDRGALWWNITGHLRSSYAREYPSMVSAVAFSPNGDSILAHDFSTALLWKIKSSSSLPFENFLPFEGHKHAITYLAFSPDGQSILTGSRDRTARLWNIKDQSFISFEGHEGPVNTVAFSPDGQYILTGSGDKIARLWKIGFLLYDEHEGPVNSIALSPDGQFILTGSDDKTVRLWNIKDRSFIPFTGHEDAVTSVAFSPKGQFILSGSKDHTARLWNIKDQSYIPFIGHEDAVTSVAFSPDGQYILTGSNDNTVRQWNLNGSGLPFFFMCTSPKSAVFSPNGELVLCTGSVLATLYNEDGSSVLFDRHDDLISSLAFSPDGESILTGSWDRTARLWNIDDQSFIRFEGHEGPVLSVAFSPDGQYILTGSEDKTVRLWNIQGRLIQTFEGLKSPVISVAFSSDDGQLVMIGCRDGTVMLRDNFFKQWETGAVWDNLYKLN